LPSAVSAEERRHDPDIEIDDPQMAESEGGSVEKQAWDVVSWTSDMIFSVTATDSQKEKAEAERLFQKKLQRDLKRQNLDMKTVLDLKKLMNEDPVSVTAVQAVAKERGLVSNRVRKMLWPKLLGLNPHALAAQSITYQKASGQSHTDAGIVYEDVRRSAWIRLFCESSGVAKSSIEVQHMRQLQRLINGVVCSNVGSVHYVQGLHEVAAVLLMVLGETAAYQVLETILMHHLRDGSGSKEGVDLIMNHLRLFAFLLDKVDPEMLHILKVVLEAAEIDDQADMEFKIMFLPWILTWFSAVLIPEPTGDRFTTSAKAGPADFGAQHGFGAMFGAAPKAEGAAAAMEVEELDMFDVSYQDRLAVAARLFDLFIVSDPLMPVYVGVALLTLYKPLILQKEGSPEGRRNPSQVGRWVVHQLPAMIDSFKINELITEALRLHDKIPPHRLMADGLMLPVVSSFYTFPYVWMDQPIRIDRILAVNGKKENADRYEGSRNRKGELHGYGRYKYSNGNMYEGKFDEGQRSGLGRFIWARTSEKYEGEWKHDERHGYGVHVWHDGTKFQGQFRLNKMEGNGQYIWPDGRSYVGRFKADKQHGLGIFTGVDGEVNAAEWIDGAISRSVDSDLARNAKAEAMEAGMNARKRKIMLLELLHHRSSIEAHAKKVAAVGMKTRVMTYLGFKDAKAKTAPEPR